MCFPCISSFFFATATFPYRCFCLFSLVLYILLWLFVCFVPFLFFLLLLFFVSFSFSPLFIVLAFCLPVATFLLSLTRNYAHNKRNYARRESVRYVCMYEWKYARRAKQLSHSANAHTHTHTQTHRATRLSLAQTFLSPTLSALLLRFARVWCHCLHLSTFAPSLCARVCAELYYLKQRQLFDYVGVFGVCVLDGECTSMWKRAIPKTRLYLVLVGWRVNLPKKSTVTPMWDFGAEILRQTFEVGCLKQVCDLAVSLPCLMGS